MARMPDGWVFIVESDKLGTKVQMKGSRELVMCENCKHYRPYKHDRGDDSRCELWNAETGEDEYCSRGERRENE